MLEPEELSFGNSLDLKHYTYLIVHGSIYCSLSGGHSMLENIESSAANSRERFSVTGLSFEKRSTEA